MPGPRSLTRSNSKRAELRDPATSRRPGASPQEFLIAATPCPPRESHRQKYPEAVIGLALGSPTEGPLFPLPTGLRSNPLQHQEGLNSIWFPPPASTTGTDEADAGGRANKAKGNRWKVFGGLFSRKESSFRVPETQPFYQLHREPRLEQPSAPPIQSARNTRKRAGSDKSKNSTETGPQRKGSGNGGRYLLRRRTTKRQGLRKRTQTDADVGMQRSHTFPPPSTAEQSPQPQFKDDSRKRKSPEYNLGETPLLELDIPSVELERYSVMFNNILTPESGSPPQTLRSSLLARRQGHLEEMKPFVVSKEKVRLSGL